MKIVTGGWGGRAAMRSPAELHKNSDSEYIRVRIPSPPLKLYNVISIR